MRKLENIGQEEKTRYDDEYKIKQQLGDLFHGGNDEMLKADEIKDAESKNADEGLFKVYTKGYNEEGD